MKTLDRYLLSSWARTFGIGLVGLVTLLLLQSLSSDLFDRQYPTEQVLKYHLLNIPHLAVQLTPPAVLLATVITLSLLSRHNELVAMYSIGMGLARIALVIGTAVWIVCCLVLVAQDRVIPAAFKVRTGYYWRVMQKRPDFFLDFKKDKIWYRSNNLIYNLQRFDTQTQTIHGMSVYTFDDEFNLIQVIGAERAEFTPQGWRLMNGTVTMLTDGEFPLTQKFDKKDLIIRESPTDFQEIDREVDGLRFKELFSYIRRLRAAGADTKKYEVKFHSRISISFISLVMCFLAIPFSISVRREGSLARDLSICLGFTFFYWLFYSVGLSLGTNGALPPWVAAWFPSVVFAVWAMVLIARQRR